MAAFVTLPCLPPIAAGCFTAPPAPASPAAIEVPEPPRSPSAAFKSERQERRITCVMIETERREVDAAMTKIGKDRASLVCLKPRLKNPPQGGKAVEAALECVVYWPFCALLGAAAVIDYEVKRQPCPDERARAAKDAALAQRLEQLSERMKSQRKLAEEKGCAAPL